jgi:hypothetical protein
MTAPSIPGYAFGSAAVAASPIDLAAFALLRQTVLFTEEDEHYLRLAGDVLEDQIDAVLDLWYGFVGSHPHLLAYFSTADGTPITDYLTRVRARFGQWILDTTRRPYDQAWLDYQAEIGLRHHSSRKNRVDEVPAAPIIPLRYLVAFIFPITATIRPFLARRGHSAEEVEKMHQAWFKSIVLQVVLWSHPYVRDGEF